MWGRLALSVVALVLTVSFGYLGSAPLRIGPGPADPAYSVDLPARYRVAESSFFRWTGRSGGFDLPWRLTKPATLRVLYTLAQESTPIAVSLEGEVVGQGTLVEGTGEVRWVLPPGRRLSVRFSGDTRTDSPEPIGVGGGAPRHEPNDNFRLRVTFWSVEISGPARGRLPSLSLFLASLALPLLVLALLLLARLDLPQAVALALAVAGLESFLIRADPYNVTRIVERLLVPTALVGGIALALTRKTSPWIYAAFLVGLLLRFGIVLHPSAYHYDHAAHVGLVQFLLDKGLFEFWREKENLQIELNVGELNVAGEKFALPYPTLFYLLAAPVAKMTGSVDGAVMALAAALSSIEVFLVAVLAAALLPTASSARYAAWVAALYPATYGILTIALYPSLAAHVVETGVAAVIAMDALGKRRVPGAVIVMGIILAAAFHVSALIDLALFSAALAVIFREKRPMLLGAAGVVASVAISYRSVFALLPVLMSTPGEPSYSRYAFQLEPPQSFSFMGGLLWLALGCLGLALLRRVESFRVLLAWAASFLVLRGLRVALGPAGAHLKELQWVAPLVCVSIGWVLDWASLRRGRWVGPVAIAILAASAVSWTLAHERWLLPIRAFSD